MFMIVLHLIFGLSMSRVFCFSLLLNLDGVLLLDNQFTFYQELGDSD